MPLTFAPYNICRPTFPLNTDFPKNTHSFFRTRGYVGLYGAIAINGGKQFVLVGQFINKKISAKLFNSLIHEHNLDWSEKEALQAFIETIPNISYNRSWKVYLLMMPYTNQKTYLLVL